ncbi:hypothetical protein [Aequorivita capsosiphonis]|uniref:hypothetical protein n=1 Tax=Aequorivita capsosiphonis TaxID=487317 RepID=UPI000412B687|nr:hypothetical protein [Aequorivita capsosiphonis]
MSYNPTDIFTYDELKKIIKSNEINEDVIIRGETIKSLDDVEKVNGFLGFSDAGIESLGTLKEVKNNFFISSFTTYSNLKSLNELEFVGGDMILRYSNIQDLGALKKVGGKVSLRDTKIENLGSLEFVGGDLYLPKRIEKEVDLSKVTVKGKVKFWNDCKKREKLVPKSEMGFYDYESPIPHWNHKYIYSYNEIREANPGQAKFYRIYKQHFLNHQYIDVKGNDNYTFILFFDLLQNHNSNTKEVQNHLDNLVKYYPITKSYGQSAIIEQLESADNYEKSWELINQNEYISIKTILEYEQKLNRELLNGELITKLGGYSHLTEFGQNNIKDIKPFAGRQLELYKQEKGSRFFDLFFENGQPIKIKKEVDLAPKKSLLSFLKKQKSEFIYEYSSEYYKNFFLSNAEYEHYKGIDDYQAESGYINSLPHVVEKSIFNQFRLILKQAEDVFREEIGMPKVGEGWISETELFYKISDYFKAEEVIHHASPKWLGRQHLDIYLPKLNIGIEYQGAQHYEPIEIFGGQEAFERTVERDIRKKQLCEKHNCVLIYADKGYDLDAILKTIEGIKNSEED